jgi:hypothetical protein
LSENLGEILGEHNLIIRTFSEGIHNKFLENLDLN